MAMLSEGTHAEFSLESQIECLLVKNLTNLHVPNLRDLADRFFKKEIPVLDICLCIFGRERRPCTAARFELCTVRVCANF